MDAMKLAGLIFGGTVLFVILFFAFTALTVKPEVQQSGEPAAISLDGAAVEGSSDAKVTLVEFSDFGCSFCSRFHSQTLPQIREQYVKTGKVRFVYMHFPLAMHADAQKAAEAAECAGEQGKFWEMHDWLYQNQGNLGVRSLKSEAAALGLDTAKFDSCLDSGKYEAKVKGQMAEGQEHGVRGTPSFFVNGRMLAGAQPFSVFQAVIEEELAKN
ncbi:MAG: DsbA family protein [Candidatus Bilamarchaeaceae archaeon]